LRVNRGLSVSVGPQRLTSPDSAHSESCCQRKRCSELNAVDHVPSSRENTPSLVGDRERWQRPDRRWQKPKSPEKDYLFLENRNSLFVNIYIAPGITTRQHMIEPTGGKVQACGGTPLNAEYKNNPWNHLAINATDRLVRLDDILRSPPKFACKSRFRGQLARCGWLCIKKEINAVNSRQRRRCASDCPARHDRHPRCQERPTA